MGASSSTEHNVSPEQKEVESLAASTGALPMLHNAFSKLVNPETNTIPLHSLQQCFRLNYENPTFETPTQADSFVRLLDHVGSSIVDLFFVPDKGGLNWVDFVRGYVNCCGRMPVSKLFNILIRVFAGAATRAGLPLKLEFESSDADCKIFGSLLPTDVHCLLWMCWTLSWDAETLKFSKGKADLHLPNVNHVVLSAVISCADMGNDFNVWDCNISDLEIQLQGGKFLTWALATVPNLSDCITQFVQARLQNCVSSENIPEPSISSMGEISSTQAYESHLLSRGRAWAVSLSLRGSLREEILKVCYPSGSDVAEENLLYRSSLHGKGLNRFWSNVEGYLGPSLILVSANSGDAGEDGTSARKWIIGALTEEGFENKDNFYGSSGNLYAISPVFHTYLPSGKEKNFVYSHLHPTGRAYDPHPKPVGIAFGGTMGNERIFIDEDFSKVTIRHHAADKTYQPGFLIPDQGYLAVEAQISEVEVWGLGGKKAKQIQDSLKKREELFTEQRRKIDLKTFANWEDSPEKMMMDMMSNPNTVKREDR